MPKRQSAVFLLCALMAAGIVICLGYLIYILLAPPALSPGVYRDARLVKEVSALAQL